MNAIRSTSNRRPRRDVGLVITLLLALLVATPALAQRRSHGPPPPDVRADHLQQALDLTDAQAERLETIFDRQRERMRALWDDGADDREARRDALRAIRDETRDRVAEVLTEEQLERFEELGEQRRKHRRRGGPPGGRRGPG